jgi:hypothetical protein
VVQPQCVGLPAGPVESEHQLPDRSLTQRVLGGAGEQLCQHLFVVPADDLGVDEQVAGGLPQFGQATGDTVP